MAKSIVEVTGFPELEKKIKALSDDKSKKREIIGVLKQVASSTVKAARENAPKSKKEHIARGKVIQPGNLKKSIGTIVGKKGNAKDNPTVYVGPRAKGSFLGWYGHIVENGHYVYRNESLRGKVTKKGRKRRVNERITRKRGGNKVSYWLGVRYMADAYERTKGAVTQESEAKVARYIQRRIDKLSR